MGDHARRCGRSARSRRVLTAYYMGRGTCSSSAATRRLVRPLAPPPAPPAALHPHDRRRVMRVPLVVLAVGCGARRGCRPPVARPTSSTGGSARVAAATSPHCRALGADVGVAVDRRRHRRRRRRARLRAVARARRAASARADVPPARLVQGRRLRPLDRPAVARRWRAFVADVIDRGHRRRGERASPPLRPAGRAPAAPGAERLRPQLRARDRRRRRRARRLPARAGR